MRGKTVARAAGISIDQIADDVPIQTVSTGNPFAMVKLKSLNALQNLKASWSSLEPYLKKTDAKFLYFVSSRDTES